MPDALTLSASIPAPVDRVFALLTDPARFPEWLPGCREALARPAVKQGAMVKVRFGRRSTTFEIIDCHNPTSLGWVEHGGRSGTKTFFHLAFAGGSTAVRMKHVATPPSLGAWLRAKVSERRNPRRVMDQMLQNLKNLTVTK